MIGQNMNKRRIKVFLYQTDFPHNILFSIRGQRAFHTCQCGLCGPMSVSCQGLIFKKIADFRTNISRQSPTEFVFWITQVTRSLRWPRCHCYWSVLVRCSFTIFTYYYWASWGVFRPNIKKKYMIQRFKFSKKIFSSTKKKTLIKKMISCTEIVIVIGPGSRVGLSSRAGPWWSYGKNVADLIS